MSILEVAGWRRIVFGAVAFGFAQMIFCGCAGFGHGEKKGPFNPELLIGAASSRVSMTTDGNLQWRVQASVNGVTGLFALDTGSETTVLDRGFAQKLNLLEGSLPGHFVGRNLVGQQVRYARIQNLELGGLEYLNFYAPIMNLEHINRSMRTKIDGILGNNLLGKTACTFDWRKNILTLDAGTPQRPLAAIPVTQRDLHLYLTAQINGKRTPLELDTGSYATCLSVAQIRRLKIPASRKIEVEAPRIDISEAGRAQQTRVMLDNFRVGEIERTNVAAMTWDYDVLGMDFLQNWILSFDARNGWMALTEFP
jgi:predicted aspartyl protease